MSTDCWDDDDLDYGDDEDRNCQTCCGEQIEECHDILGCFEAGCNGDYHRCPNCKGSGLAKDQCYW